MSRAACPIQSVLLGTRAENFKSCWEGNCHFFLQRAVRGPQTFVSLSCIFFMVLQVTETCATDDQALIFFSVFRKGVERSERALEETVC